MTKQMITFSSNKVVGTVGRLDEYRQSDRVINGVCNVESVPTLMSKQGK